VNLGGRGRGLETIAALLPRRLLLPQLPPADLESDAARRAAGPPLDQPVDWPPPYHTSFWNQP